jgi:hypothetical protein
VNLVVGLLALLILSTNVCKSGVSTASCRSRSELRICAPGMHPRKKVGMVDTLRLARSVSCPECCNRVKPFILEKIIRDIGRGDETATRVQCPVCEHVFQVFKEDA